jgi:[NiFe] hydrogenase assembly HybE family chaperone
MAISEINLVNRFRAIGRGKMRGLPICNTRLEVEAVGFAELDGHRMGVLITPWFMNLILLPGDETWSTMADGTADSLTMPGDTFEFTICQDDELGTYLSAVLFRTVIDFPDQQTTVAIAENVLEQLLTKTADARHPPGDKQGISRRTLLTGLGAP